MAISGRIVYLSHVEQLRVAAVERVVVRPEHLTRSVRRLQRQAVVVRTCPSVNEAGDTVVSTTVSVVPAMPAVAPSSEGGDTTTPYALFADFAVYGYIRVFLDENI